jgi:hypothetical protein
MHPLCPSRKLGFSNFDDDDAEDGAQEVELGL